MNTDNPHNAVPDNSNFQPAAMRWVVKAFVFKGEKLLVLTRRPRTRGAGFTDSLIDLPGGIVEPGESLEEALLRETREEVNLDVKLGAPMRTSLLRKGERSMVQTEFLAEWSAGSVRLSPEHTRAQWMTLSQIRQTNDSLCPVVEEAFTLRNALSSSVCA